LSAERPQNSVFSPYMMLSIVLQFALHLYTLISAVELARPFTPTDAETRDPNGKFAPNLLNSVVFLVGQMMNVATFGINYSGRPFMESLRENKALFYGLSAVGTLILMCVLNISPDLMELMELVPFPNDEVSAEYLLWFLISKA
jgi:cation-transporting ATPase 13A1